MKRFLPLLAFALAASAAVSAQGLRYGVTGAMNVSSFSMKSGGVSLDTDSRVAFNAGFKMELDAPFIMDGFYMDAELLLSAKGTKYSYTADELYTKTTSRPYYLELPVHLGYRYTFGEGNMSVFGSFGPYFSLGIFGKTETYDGVDTVKNDVFGSDGLQRFDFGLGLRAGVEVFDHYQVFLGYDWGLLNTAKDTADGFKVRNRNFYLGVAYMF